MIIRKSYRHQFNSQGKFKYKTAITAISTIAITVRSKKILYRSIRIIYIRLFISLRAIKGVKLMIKAKNRKMFNQIP